MPKWRNWHTRTTQNRVPYRVEGSTPSFGTSKGANIEAKRIKQLGAKSVGLLSQAIISNDFIFVAGQIHSTTDGTLINGLVEEKIKQIMYNIQAILKAAGTDLNDIVKATIYVTEMQLLPELNKLYPSYFNEPLPAREGICVKELPLGASIEISVIAAKR